MNTTRVEEQTYVVIPGSIVDETGCPCGDGEWGECQLLRMRGKRVECMNFDVGIPKECPLHNGPVIIKTNEGLVIILGCAHRGAINTVRHAQEITGVTSIHTVIGGTHLLHASEERVLRTGIALQELGVQRVGVSHCTGLPSAMLLAHQLGEAFFFNNTGTSITVV